MIEKPKPRSFIQNCFAYGAAIISVLAFVLVFCAITIQILNGYATIGFRTNKRDVYGNTAWIVYLTYAGMFLGIIFGLIFGLVGNFVKSQNLKVMLYLTAIGSVFISIISILILFFLDVLI